MDLMGHVVPTAGTQNRIACTAAYGPSGDSHAKGHADCNGRHLSVRVREHIYHPSSKLCIREQVPHVARRYLLEPRELRDSACMQLSMDCRLSAVDGSFSLSQPPCKQAGYQGLGIGVQGFGGSRVVSSSNAGLQMGACARHRPAIPDTDRAPEGTAQDHVKACQPTACITGRPCTLSAKLPGNYRALPSAGWVDRGSTGPCLSPSCPRHRWCCSVQAAWQPLPHPSQAQPDCESQIPSPEGRACR